jgi:2-hydroxychromene-2-carboxylate isomerase
MAEQFNDQGGVATMDPHPLARWLGSRVVSKLFTAERMARKRASAEKKRRAQGAPHRVEYFHEVDDGYSHLAAQLLQKLVARYDIELTCHLVKGPEGNNVADLDMLLQLSRYDSHLVAPQYGLVFPDHPEPPAAELVELASAILAAKEASTFVDCVVEVGQALWDKDETALRALADSLGAASQAETAQKIAMGTERRAELKHYSGAMFYYAGEWYWGVDRLYHLEQRLADLGADCKPGEPLLAPRPEIEVGETRDTGTLTLEVYPSLRSPYTAISFDRAVKLAEDTGVKLVVRPVLPMVMRGVPATREKGLYIFMDTAREARSAGVPYGKSYDPIGDPVRRCYSIYPWAIEQGRGNQLISSFLRHAWALGVNTNNERGLRRVVEGAGLDWSEAKQHLGEPGWEDLLEENRLAMYEQGLWGVPSFRLFDAQGEQVLALWGQDRLWLVAQEIQRLIQPAR